MHLQYLTILCFLPSIYPSLCHTNRVQQQTNLVHKRAKRTPQHQQTWVQPQQTNWVQQPQQQTHFVQPRQQQQQNWVQQPQQQTHFVQPRQQQQQNWVQQPTNWVQQPQQPTHFVQQPQQQTNWVQQPEQRPNRTPQQPPEQAWYQQVTRVQTPASNIDNWYDSGEKASPVVLQAATSPQDVDVPQSPCPDVFTYALEGGEWVGVAQLTAPVDRSTSNLVVTVSVILTVQSLLTSSYAGKLELYEDKNTVVQRLQAGSQLIKYRVRFPSQSPLPECNNIVVNQASQCQGKTPGGPGKTTLTLSHKFVAFLVWPAGSDSEDPPSIPGTRPRPTPPSSTTPRVTEVTTRPARVTTRPPRVTTTARRPPTVTTTTRPVRVTTTRPPIVTTMRPTRVTQATTTTTQLPIVSQSTSQDDKCGTVVSGLSLILNGQGTQRGQWPWLSALFSKTATGLDFQCGGTLVSTTHVVTAAHCVITPANRKVIQADSMLVYLGKYSLRSWTETNSQPRDLQSIVVHPQYQSGGDRTDFDLAVLVLDSPVLVTISVRPVCLWHSASQQALLDHEGTVVGWGRDEQGNRVSDVPKMVKMPLVTQEECLRSHRNFFYFTTDNTFCAGGRDGNGPCSGDSGGGMYLPQRSSDGSTRWTLRGVVSLALPDENTKLCDLHNYVVFTDMTRLTSWVNQVISS